MQSHQSLSNLSLVCDLFNIEALKMLLRNTPTSRTNYYFESKSILGFKENLHEEIQDLLVELQAAEENLSKIIKIFLFFIDRQEAFFNEKEQQIFNLMTENEKLIMKISLGKGSSDPMLQENIALLEKNAQLTQEIEILDKQCQKYEEIIESLQIAKKKEKLAQGKNLSFDINRKFLEHYERLKETFPSYFCICFGGYEEIKLQNASLREKNALLTQANAESSQQISYLQQKLDHFETSERHMSRENQQLKNEISSIRNSRDKFLNELEEVSKSRRFKRSELRIRSVSIIRKDFREQDEFGGEDVKNRYCRSQLLRKKKEPVQNLAEIKAHVREKSRAVSRKYTNLLSEIQRSITEKRENGEGTMDHIFEHDFNELRLATQVSRNNLNLQAESQANFRSNGDHPLERIQRENQSRFLNRQTKNPETLNNISIHRFSRTKDDSDAPIEFQSLISFDKLIERNESELKALMGSMKKKHRKTLSRNSISHRIQKSDSRRTVGFADERQGNQGNANSDLSLPGPQGNGGGEEALTHDINVSIKNKVIEELEWTPTKESKVVEPIRVFSFMVFALIFVANLLVNIVREGGNTVVRAGTKSLVRTMIFVLGAILQTAAKTFSK